ncbi:hypothetical protein CLV63_116180 [Murinocardiopsis flavida]|uniref:ARG and Rhodanese-Phosphatase-superfamily-associated domain-containing protein n=1 Tax=Murinocardiopsis flavida TaxID=645275 RepID=A0A2P8D989_9ACTN|nr:hypothetical protein [Murinocardiopsis flavida]PSK93773.1 hypothetical protein CLV63_116180 [Murinocardiopsis flavida]
MSPLPGLRTAAAQVWGGIRLVPLIRDEPITDLRLHARIDDADLTVSRTRDGGPYLAYVPHAYVATWAAGGAPAAAFGTQIIDSGTAPDAVTIRVHQRFVQREARSRLRFLPLHLAMEGYLALHFGGPSVVWPEWSKQAVRAGLSPRAERSYSGHHIADLEEALRVFEILPGQCGVVVYVGDSPATAFAVPHPDDYRALHPTLLLDMYGELVFVNGLLGPRAAPLHTPFDHRRVGGIADLRAVLAEQRRAWAEFHDTLMAGSLRITDEHTVDHVYSAGNYRLERFLPPFRPKAENHIGERIVAADGTVAYLKTFRLSENQVKRGYVLAALAAHDWRLDAAADALGTDRGGLVARLDRLGFGNLLRRDLRDRFARRR